MGFPEELVNQFRGVAQERLDRIEASWAQILVSFDDDVAATLHREVHTFKGESRVLGFTDVNLVCHKLEDLLELARARGYAVDEDFDLTVNMALRFMAMLVRKKVGAQLGGIDLPGFVRQIDQILQEAKPELMGRTRTGGFAPLSRTAQPPRIPQALREQLAPLAVDAFIEYATAKGHRRNRLRTSWHAIREMIGLQRAVVGAAQLVKHKSGALALARDLGKNIEVTFEPGTAEVTSEVLNVVDIATLHLLRNAIDHGIEQREARLAAGKREVGRIRLGGGLRDDEFVLTVEDDGRGINFDRVRTRAVELGMITPQLASSLERDRLIDLICQPGFSTRSEANDVSGRGVGLDAARASVVELGGTLTAKSVDGAGCTWTVTIPVPTLTVPGHVVRCIGVPFPLVLDATWKREPGESTARPTDIAAALGIGTTEGGTPVRFVKGTMELVVLCDRAPVATTVRRLIVAPASAIGEVVALDSIESLMIRPEKL